MLLVVKRVLLTFSGVFDFGKHLPCLPDSAAPLQSVVQASGVP
jgi:hypothetical protein